MKLRARLNNVSTKTKILFFVLGVPIALFFILPPDDVRSGNSSCTLVSSENMVLHVYRDENTGSYQEWMSLRDLPHHLVQVVIATEDRFFYWHLGFNPFAMLRALWQNISSGKIISGASTITQQLVRIVYASRLPKNRFVRKICELVLALKLELHFSKDAILEAYLNRVPFPNNQSGVATASRAMFAHDVRQLTCDESCAMAVFIRRTAMPVQSFEKRFRALHAALSQKGIIPRTEHAAQLSHAMAESVFGHMRTWHDSAGKRMVENQFNPGGVAPHFVAYFREKFPHSHGIIQTPLSANLNKVVHSILVNELASVKQFGGTNGAVLVVEIPEKRDEPLLLRAMVGSVDYYDATDGQVNGVCSIRSAGSTLKPFIYALAIDLFNYRPWTLLDDAPIGFETDIEGEIFQPQNYDMKFWGTITLRDALATSRNIPAVYLVKKIGEEKFYAFLQKAGFDHLRRGPAHHGPGMALGSAGASLFELVMAYAGLAMQGEMRPLCIGRLQDGAPLSIGTRARLCSGKAALYITHILSDREARRRAFGKRNFQDFPFEVASKTGTSSDYRDAWIIGYTSKYVVGVWVGDFSGKKMQGVSGGYGAGRVFHQVMRFLEGRSSHRFGYPPSWKQVPVCRVSGKRAGNNCPSVVELAGEDDKLETMCNTCLISTSKTTFMLEASVPKIISPTNGEVFLLDPHINITNQRIPLIVSATGGAMSGYSYALDEGALVPLQSNIGQSLAAKPGKHVLRLYKDNVVVQTVHFRVEQ